MADEIDFLSKGGAWSDEALQEVVSFAGESTSSKTGLGKTVISTAQSTTSDQAKTLEQAGISDDIISLISKRVSAYVQRKVTADIKTLSDKSMLQMERLTTAMTSISTFATALDELKVLVTNIEAKTHDIIPPSTLRKIEESILSLDFKIESLQQSISDRDSTVLQISQEARDILVKYEHERERVETSLASDAEYDPNAHITTLQANIDAIASRIDTAPSIASVPIPVVKDKVQQAKRLKKLFT